MANILIVEDQPIVRQGLKLMIEHYSDCKVVGEAANGKEAIKEVEKHDVIDLVLMDIRMPEMNGIEATKCIKSYNSDIKVLVLTTFNDDEYIMEALRAGAAGYLLKDADPEAMIQGILGCLAGKVILDDVVASKVMPLLLEPTKKVVAKPEIPLTDREFSIAKLVAEGKSNDEIANDLYLSLGTVKNNITHILSKLQLRDRTQLAIYFIKNDLI